MTSESPEDANTTTSNGRQPAAGAVPPSLEAIQSTPNGGGQSETFKQQVCRARAGAPEG